MENLKIKFPINDPCEKAPGSKSRAVTETSTRPKIVDSHLQTFTAASIQMSSS